MWPKPNPTLYYMFMGEYAYHKTVKAESKKINTVRFTENFLPAAENF